MQTHTRYVAVALAAFATIALELLLTRVYSVTMYYHFAFMVISVAMLGLGVAGVVIHLLPRQITAHNHLGLAGLAMLGFAAGAIWALHVALQNPLDLATWRAHLGRIALIYVSAALPLFFAGFAISLALAFAHRDTGRLYAFDLIGAAAGCAFVIAVLSAVSGPAAIMIVAGVGAASAAMFWLAAPVSRRRLRGLGAGIGVLVAIGLVVAGLQETAAQRMGVARNPGKFLGQRQVVFEKWNSFSQITVAPSGRADHMWIFIDADAATRVWDGATAASPTAALARIPEIRLASLVYAIRHAAPALIIGPGGGTDVLSALAHGAPHVTGVEVNPIIVDDVMRGAFAAYSGGLYADPRVNVVVDEGRSFVRRTPQRFGTIQATLVDTWAASSSGAYSLSENTIYTVEAFLEFFDHLTDDGAISMTRWYDAQRPAEMLRLVAIAREALERRGVAAREAHQHFFIATDTERRGSMIVARAPLAAADLATLHHEARARGLQILYTPRADASTPALAPVLAAFLHAPSASAYLAGLPYDASPSTDNKPFFFFTLRGHDLWRVLGDLRKSEINNMGVSIAALLLVLATGLTVACIVLPLLLFDRGAIRTGNRRATLLVLGYFICLGLGFIMIEIGLMQVFVMFLGHPIHALAVVLATLLAASGVGSALSTRGLARWGSTRLIRGAIAVLAAIMLIYAVALTPLFRALLAIPIAGRIAIAVGLMIPPALLMGMLLPAGMAIARGISARTAPWAWGLNGAASVVGSMLALLISMMWGFSTSLGCGVAVYLVGAVFVARGSATLPGEHAT